MSGGAGRVAATATERVVDAPAGAEPWPPRGGGPLPLWIGITARGADLAALAAAAWLVVERSGADPVLASRLVAAIVLAERALALAGQYRTARLADLRGRLLRLALVGAVATGAVAVLLRPTASAAPLLLWLGVGGGLVGATTVATAWLARRLLVSNRYRRTLVIVGAGAAGRRLVEHLRRERDPGRRLIGLFDDRADRVPDYVAGFPVLGSIDALLAFARRHPVDEVLVALPWSAEERLLACLRRLRVLPAEIRLCPDMIGFRLPRRGVVHIAGLPTLSVFERPLTREERLMKELLDRAVALAALACLAPLLLAIALAIRLSSPGPALFRQKRHGFNNQVIEVLKFRTMRREACDDGLDPEAAQARRLDPRTTPLGRLLRRTSLDELPQLWNVLKGEMSIVGPRPHTVAHNERYAGEIDAYLARHRVKPGITGWAQVNGLRGATETAQQMEARLRHDLFYIENWSVGFDLKIMLRTLRHGLTGPGAY